MGGKCENCPNDCLAYKTSAALKNEGFERARTVAKGVCKVCGAICSWNPDKRRFGFFNPATLEGIKVIKIK